MEAGQQAIGAILSAIFVWLIVWSLAQAGKPDEDLPAEIDTPPEE